MKRRITFTADQEVLARLRQEQARRRQDEALSLSLSAILSQIIRKALPEEGD